MGNNFRRLKRGNCCNKATLYRLSIQKLLCFFFGFNFILLLLAVIALKSDLLREKDKKVEKITSAEWNLLLKSSLFVKYILKHFHYDVRKSSDPQNTVNDVTLEDDHDQAQDISLSSSYNGKAVLDLFRKKFAEGEIAKSKDSFIRSDYFKVLMQPKNICQTDKYLLVFVLSAFDNFLQRDAIRQTWAQYNRNDVTVVFVLGNTPVEMKSRIENESRTFEDIMQMDMPDHYANIVLKSVAVLHWTNDNCKGHVNFIAKVDDDTFFNVPNLLSELPHIQEAYGSSFAMGHVIKGSKPTQNTSSKWYVANHKSDPYPDYLSGGAYVISIDAVEELAAVSARITPLPLEDVYVTGYLAKEAGLRLVNNRKFVAVKSRLRHCLFRFVISAHGLSPDDLVKIWVAIHDYDASCQF